MRSVRWLIFAVPVLATLYCVWQYLYLKHVVGLDLSLWHLGIPQPSYADDYQWWSLEGTAISIATYYFFVRRARHRTTPRGFEVVEQARAVRVQDNQSAAMDRPRVERSGELEVGRRGAGH